MVKTTMFMLFINRTDFFLFHVYKCKCKYETFRNTGEESALSHNGHIYTSGHFTIQKSLD